MITMLKKVGENYGLIRIQIEKQIFVALATLLNPRSARLRDIRAIPDFTFQIIINVFVFIHLGVLNKIAKPHHGI